MNITTYKFWNQ